MKKVFQTLFSVPDKDGNLEPYKIGNCWQACVASIFEKELNEVPHFIMKEDGTLRNDEESMQLFVEYLDKIGYRPIEIKLEFDGRDLNSWIHGIICIATVDNGSNRHCIVTKGKNIIHDPLSEEIDHYKYGCPEEWVYTIFVKKFS